MTHPDDAGRRIGEALRAQASRGPVPPQSPADRPRPDRGRMPPPPPAPRVPGRLPPPAPRPAPVAPTTATASAAYAAPAAPATGTDRAQIVWALVVTLLVGAILGGGLALVSLLLPGVLPNIG